MLPAQEKDVKTSKSGGKIWGIINPLYTPLEDASSASSSANPTELGLQSDSGARESSSARSASSEDELEIVHGVSSLIHCLFFEWLSASLSFPFLTPEVQRDQQRSRT
jgi:hypothetical protein